MADNDNRKLFRHSVGEVRLVYSDRDQSSAPKPLPIPRFSIQDEAMAVDELLLYRHEEMDVDCGEPLQWAKEGIRAKTQRRLRQGKYAIADELDLHGFRVEPAQLAIIEFIDYALAHQYTCVCIIHGKGLHSRAQPKLKQLTAKILRQMPGVLAYCSARPVDGGTGTVYVLLRAA